MKQMPTAEEFLNNHPQISHYYDDKTDKMVCFSEQVEQAMIEFAKLHVEACKKDIIENVEMTYDSAYNVIVDKESILNSYSLENIK